MYPQRSVMTCGLATALEPPHFNHAPVRGAIGASFSRRSRAGSFNPRTRVGCDNGISASGDTMTVFQSTHPRGVRPGDTGPQGPAGEFQSTHPRGVRLHNRRHQRRAAKVSIHAPAWGATLLRSSTSFRSGRFNPRPRVGCDAKATAKERAENEVSIHAPAWGATRQKVRLFFRR